MNVGFDLCKKLTWTLGVRKKNLYHIKNNLK